MEEEVAQKPDPSSGKSGAKALLSFRFFFILIMMAAAVGITTTGYYAYMHERDHLRVQNEKNLANIAHLKSEQITNWLTERTGDANVLSRSFLSHVANDWILNGCPDNDDRKQLLSRMDVVRKSYAYESLTLLDRDGNARLSTAKSGTVPDQHVKKLAIESIQTGKAQISTIHDGDNGKPEIDMVAPLFLLDKNNNKLPLGVIFFKIDPAKFLFPLVQTWPIASDTAETLIVERSKDEVLFLNQLRHYKKTALKLRIPLSTPNLPAAVGLRGKNGVVTGVDYRGEKVLAYVLRIPDTPWVIVAKIDTKEVYEPLQTMSFAIVGMGVLLFIVIGMGIHLRLRKNEEEIRRYHEHLKTERVKQLYVEKLEAANKELEAFSYSVSHDLRTPLRAIDGYSLILLEDYENVLDEEGKRLLSVVRENTSKMSQLINDILAFSRAGRLDMNISRVDLGSMANSIFKELITNEKAREIHFSCDCLPAVEGDGTMIRQVFVNLLSNAIKFTKDRDVANIEFRCEKTQEEVVCHIKDNGVGFDMKYVHKLFGVFQRLHRVDEFEGTGIGLAIAKRIVERHGGRIWAQGEIDKGATIYFTFPTKGVKVEQQ